MARILVIDDDAAVRAGLVRILERAGHLVEVAGNGLEALRIFDVEAADLIITDINMPEMDGIEIILESQRRWPGVPVIAISGGGRMPRELLLQNADVLGAVESLPKPFEIAEVLGAVERALRATGGATPSE